MMLEAAARFTAGHERETTSRETWQAESEYQHARYRRLPQDEYAVHTYGDFYAINRDRPLRPRTVGEVWEALPETLIDIRRLIEASRSLLTLPPNWDDENAKPIEEKTWKRAAKFLSRYALRLWKIEGNTIRPPDIMPVPDGTIDIHWDRPEFELLVNIPCGDNDMAEFYGDDRGCISIKGEFDSSQLNEGLIHWLRKS